MRKLFHYNWQVRQEWFAWCRTVPEEELLKPRLGGMGSILRTLFHVADVEYSWVRILRGLPDFQEPFEDYGSLVQVEQLSARLHPEVSAFLDAWEPGMEGRLLDMKDDDGSPCPYTHGEILRHVIAHEIHHMGQLSVWAREAGAPPVNANLIGRGIH